MAEALKFLAHGGAVSASARPRPGARRSIAALAALLLVVAGVDLLCMPAGFSAGDPPIWREEAKAVLRGQLSVDSRLIDTFGKNGEYLVQNTRNARWYSKYGIVNSLMALPPMLIDRWVAGALRPMGVEPDLWIFNLYQIFLSLLVCAVLYRLTGWYTPRITTRVLYVLAVFYGTYFWYYQRAQSSEVYQVLFFTAFFSFFVGYLRKLWRTEGRPGWGGGAGLLAAWLFVGVLVLTRILFGLLIPAMIVAAVAVIWRLGPVRRWGVLLRQVGLLAGPPCVIVGVLGWINWVKFGSPLLTGYHVSHLSDSVPRGRLWDGVWGLLFDMQGSVLWYFPVLLFALAALPRFYRKYKIDAVVMAVVVGVFVLVLAKIPIWRGEWTYGPRYMLFALPVLGLPFLTWVDGLLDEPRRWKTWAAVVVTAVTLLYSGYLTERQNRLDFYIYYQVSMPLEGLWDRDMARSFLDHHLGWFCTELLEHEQNLDDLPFIKQLIRQGLPPTAVREYEQRLARLIANRNYYWWRQGRQGR
ncbi:MAG: hypothetical protein K8S99_02020 [Planctomycetes bacterium]|nr:hypothetical protein [Planctomycetota bacterium]